MRNGFHLCKSVVHGVDDVCVCLGERQGAAWEGRVDGQSGGRYARGACLHLCMLRRGLDHDAARAHVGLVDLDDARRGLCGDVGNRLVYLRHRPAGTAHPRQVQALQGRRGHVRRHLAIARSPTFDARRRRQRERRPHTALRPGVEAHHLVRRVARHCEARMHAHARHTRTNMHARPRAHSIDKGMYTHTHACIRGQARAESIL
mmetsp:Transcript_38309/g.84173  ORF Transcript_38309/g.84173 Transcript_38309/m.84173 type:complete len:204 (-) Transcript_38309:401-1012(-)